VTRTLILGGTTEAARLARALAGMDVVTSLAGRTEGLPDLPGDLRVGGFGGVEGLEAYLREAGIGRVVDATHPFAARISAHAAEACARAGIPMLRLERPAWVRQPGDHWIEAANMEEAAETLPRLGRRAFLTVGIGEVERFARVKDVWFLVRLIAAQDLALTDYTVVTGKGPFDAQAEQKLMATHAIDVLVTKASGGTATYPKIEAARTLGLPVLMVQRPEKPKGLVVDGVDAAAGWCRT
jgi:precorrin-6A/cobalt-precorrin-6A reductase